MVPHVRHSDLMAVVVVAAGSKIRAFVKKTNRKTLKNHYVLMQLHVIGLGLTFAGLHAIGPPVIDIFAAKSSAVLEPSAARSTTTDSA